MTEPTVLYVAGVDHRGDATASALDGAGLDVIAADGPLDAVARIDDGQVDCVVLSIPLGGPGADRLVREVRPERPSVPIVLVGTDDAAAARALAAGATEHLSRENVDRIADRVRDLTADREFERALDRHRELKDRVLAVATALPAAADGREVERVVFEELSTLDRYRFVWLGTYDHDSKSVHTRFPVPGAFDPGVDPDDAPGIDAEFVERAVSSGRVTVGDGRARSDGSTSRTEAPSAVRQGDDSLVTVAVPLAHGGTTHGVVLLGVDRTAGPGDAERSLLGDLGAVVGRELERVGDGERAAGDVEVRRFAEGFAHEVRNALGIASTHLELGLEGDEEAFDRAREALDDLARTVDGMLSLAADVEDASERDLREDVRDAWDAVEPSGAELVVDDTEPIVADHDQVVLLLSNLVRNAVEHGSTSPGSQARQDAVGHGSTSDGDGPPSPDDVREDVETDGEPPDGNEGVTVRVGMLEDGFYVEDDGPGVPPERRDQIFEWGYSGDDGGIGLGLAIVDAVAEAHGWSVAATEGRDGGARFEVTGVRRPSD